MLRNTRLGTKLLAVVLPPLIVLVVVAGIGARDRLGDASDAREAETFISLAEKANVLIDNLQWERTLSVFKLSGGVASGDPLGEQRPKTDQAWSEYEELANDVRDMDPSMAELIDNSLNRTGDIDSYRVSIDSEAATTQIVNTYFSEAIASQMNVITEIGNRVPLSEVSADLTTFGALVRAKEAIAQMATIMTIVLSNGEFDLEGLYWRSARDAEKSLERYTTLYYDIALAEQSATLRGALNSAVSTQSERFRLDVVDQVGASLNWLGDGRAFGDPVQLDANPIEWMNLSDARARAVGDVGAGIIALVSDTVAELRSDAEQAALLFLLVTAAAVLLSGVLAVVVARRITKPLRQLTDAADRMSTTQLPALVERLRTPSATAERVFLEPIAMNRTDEIGHLADAFDAIQRVTIEVAEEQSNLLKKGIGDIFVNLARRNQTLLDRQIEFIDQLESAEEDPDVLSDLFKLDHLATRMRRNAESLLVLAGVETGHRRSRPVPLPDVVRVAIGEVEDFARINLLAIDDAVISGTAAMDVAHLLSELMENATAYSPPETRVEVLGHRNRDGGYVISISDQGIGMSDEQFADVNRLLAEPPLVGLTLSRSLGFTVVGRLAARFGINVRLTSSPTGGVTALVALPENILSEATITVEPEPQAPEPQTMVEPVESLLPPMAAAPAVEQAPRYGAEPFTREPEPVSYEPEPFTREPEPVSYEPEPTRAAERFEFDSSEQIRFEPPHGTAQPDRDEPFSPTPGGSIFSSPEPAAPAPSFEPAPERSEFEPMPDWARPEQSAPADLASALPEESAFDRGLAALMGEEPSASLPPPPIEPPSPAVQPAPADDYTNSGLVRRVPRTSFPAVEATDRLGDNAPIVASQRSPEEVRAMLSRYRSGLRRGDLGDRGDDGNER